MFYNMSSKIAVRTLVGEMAVQRAKKREVLLDEDKNLSLVRARLPGPPYVGKDAEGQPVLTRPPESLKMRVSAMCAEIKYRREESGKIDETFAEGTKIPRKQITVKTDIFRAVRGLKHVREGYENDFEKRDEILREVEKINSELAMNGGNMAKGQLEQIENRLDKVLEEISPDMAAVKKLGRFKIEEIFEYLEPAKYLQRFEKQAMITAACSKLVAFRNRYGEWRDGQVARIMAYNKLRECSLRKERDNALVHLLNDWAGFIEKYGYAAPKLWKRDAENAKRITGLIVLVKTGFPGAIARLVEIGQGLKGNWIENEAKKELRLVYRELKKGSVENGLWHLKRAAEILEWNKPWRIADELEKTGEEYMEITIRRIRTALELLLEKNHVLRSVELFREAAQKI